VVLDTNQIVAAGTRWIDHGRPSPDPNICRRIVVCVAESHTGLYSGKIIAEYLEKLVDRNHPPTRTAKLITYLMGAFTPISITSTVAPVRPSDLDDEVFLLCAIDGYAHYLVSEDNALLDLKASYTPLVIGRSVDLAAALGA